VLEHPTLVGVGIDERTAAIVSGPRFEVIGESSVLVVDAGRATVEPREAGKLSAARNVTIHILTAGMGMEIRN
jgi:cyanophycinase